MKVENSERVIQLIDTKIVLNIMLLELTKDDNIRPIVFNKHFGNFPKYYDTYKLVATYLLKSLIEKEISEIDDELKNL